MLNSRTFVKQLRRAADVTGHYRFVEAAVARGDIELLRRLFAEVAAAYPAGGEQHWQSQAVLDRFVEALALDDREQTAAAAWELAQRLYEDSPWRADGWRRALCSRIVFARSPATITRLLTEFHDLETLGLLLHEAVAQQKLTAVGADSGEAAAAAAVASLLDEADHPLAALPLLLSPLERDLPLTHYSTGNTATLLPGPLGAPDPPASPTAPSPPGDQRQGWQVAETTTSERSSLMAAAVAGWIAESNGVAEARAFDIQPLPRSCMPTSLLEKLQLECFDAAPPPAAGPTPPAEVFAALFAAAAHGGAYGGAQHAAYGRLRVWQSLGGLVGADEGEPIEDLLPRVVQADWWAPSTRGPWFANFAWDLAIACVDRTGGLAVLAATDTD